MRRSADGRDNHARGAWGSRAHGDPFPRSSAPVHWPVEKQLGVRLGCTSLLFSGQVMSNSLQSHRLQHTRLPCPSLSFMSIESVMPSNHLILCCHLLLLPSILPRTKVFFSKLTLHIRWPKYWSLSFSISPSNEHAGLISFRIDWFDLAVQGTLNCLLRHHSRKASILWCSAFFII